MGLFSNITTIAGGIIGGMGSGGAGAAQGAMIGKSFGDAVDPQRAAAQEIQKPQVGPVDAISRRKAQLDQTPLRQIRDSIDSLKYVQNNEVRAELAKPLLQAEYMAKQQGQV
jgi:hypothetical protein